jgi:hypothetical protein
MKGLATEKLFYWSTDLDWPKEWRPNLLLYAKRLDREVPVVFGPYPAGEVISGLGEHGAISTGIDLPPGCWKIIAKYRDRTLSYVVSVEP